MSEAASIAFDRIVAELTRDELPSFDSLQHEAALERTKIHRAERAQLLARLTQADVRIAAGTSIAELRSLAAAISQTNLSEPPMKGNA